jgi:hypothetical protein
VPPRFPVVGVEGDGLFPIVEGGLPLSASMVNISEGPVGLSPFRVYSDGFLEELHGGVYVSDFVVAQRLFVEGPGIGIVWGAVGQISLFWCKITAMRA